MAGLIVLAGLSCKLASPGVADTAEPEHTSPAAVESPTASEIVPSSTDAVDTPTAAPTSTISAVGAGEVRQLTVSPAVDQQPAWSQDGSSLAFASNRAGGFDIYTLILETGELARRTDHQGDDLHPSWSPDSNWIAFESHRLGVPKVFVMNVKAGMDPISISGTTGVIQTGKPEYSRASADLELGRLILHEYRYEDRVGLHLLMDGGAWYGGHDDAYETLGVPLDPTWPPNGEWFAFVAEVEEAGNQDIYRVPRTGRAVLRLTEDPGADVQPHWSPDGNWIAFASDRDGDMDIYVIRVDGSGLTQLTDSPGYDGEPNWSPSGDRLAFVSDRRGSKDVYMMELSLE